MNPLIRHKQWLSIPFAKDSPFMEPMKQTFSDMAKSGVMKKIWNKYTYAPPNIQCEERKVYSVCRKSCKIFNFK